MPFSCVYADFLGVVANDYNFFSILIDLSSAFLTSLFIIDAHLSSTSKEKANRGQLVMLQKSVSPSQWDGLNCRKVPFA